MTSSRKTDFMADDVKLWQLPEILDEQKAQKEKLATASQLESIQEQAFKEAFDKGYQDGLKRAEDELSQMRQKSQDFDDLVNAMCRPFEDLDDEVVEQMAQLSIAIARQLVRREVHFEPDQVISVVREAMKELPVGSRNVQIYLHPDDAELIRQSLSMPDENNTQRLWQVVEDPVQARGGCKISADNSVIDATLETRFNRVINQMLGGERKDE